MAESDSGDKLADSLHFVHKTLVCRGQRRPLCQRTWKLAAGMERRKDIKRECTGGIPTPRPGMRHGNRHSRGEIRPRGLDKAYVDFASLLTNFVKRVLLLAALLA